MRISRRRLLSVFMAFTLFACISNIGNPKGPTASAAGYGNLEISNQYIRVFVNQSDDATGRFAVDSTGGDPLNPRDDNMPLVYGRPRPWTSYTTLKIDGQDYVFGGDTETRAGRHGMYGKRISGPEVIGGNSIVSTWRFGDIEASQMLSIVRSTTTGLLDTAKITYVVTNLGNIDHKVGVRMMLDTMLGSNDGAPFRARDRAITSDTVFELHEMPRFVQAFDSLSSPSVTSQATLMGAGATPPDRVVFTNWGNLADRVWDAFVIYGREFLREGEYELDSALALFWDAETLKPGESREYTTLYGMGGISIAPGVLALGVTSPAEVTSEKDKPIVFPIVAYVENNGPTLALDVNVHLNLPPGLTLASGAGSRESLGHLAPGETRQIAWEVTSGIKEQTTLGYGVAVEAENAERNEVYREVTILAPPRLSLSVLAPPMFGVMDDMFHPYPLKVCAKINNSGGAPAYGVKVTLTPDYGIVLAPSERSSRFPGQIVPGETCDVSWYLVPFGEAGAFDYRVKVDAQNTDTLMTATDIGVPMLRSRLLLETPASPVGQGKFFIVRILARNLKGFQQVKFDLNFDPSIVEVVYVSRGTVFVEGRRMSEWNEGVIQNPLGLLTDVYGRLTQPADITGELATIGFRAKAPGQSHVLLRNMSLLGREGQVVVTSVEHGSVIVTDK
ncbi:MAG: cellulosome anchor protein [Firmicutes bacterium]|nr:cellulosome anchor protein [Bacillota bacterium]